MYLNKDDIKNFYNIIPDVWANTPWYKYSQKVINSCIQDLHIQKNDLILNAGSGGNTYGLTIGKMIHLDIAENKLMGIPNSCVGSIENIPFDNNIFDVTICVGSVLNYCDCVKSISELLRTLKKDGVLLLEFESSWSYEYIKKPFYKQDVALISTNYIENNHKQWLFSPQYVKKIISSCGGIIKGEIGYHLLSGLVANFTNKDSICCKLTPFDIFFSYLPFINNHYSNLILNITKSRV